LVAVWLGGWALDKEPARQHAMPEQAFCEQFADAYSAPLKCYKYFGVQQIGERQVGKSNVPVLVPTP